MTPPATSHGRARHPDEEAGRLTAVLGPTNTGKTHLAIERMLARESGIMGLPLRLLAREVYDRVVKVKGRAAAALITGEEKIAPPTARYFICTVEAMPQRLPNGGPPAFVAIDEVQLAADPERGHVFTDRLLNARGRDETMLLGADTMRPLIRALASDAAHVRRERFSELAHAGPKKLTKLPRRTAIVAFSAGDVYAIAELLRRQRGGAAVVMGALSPRTRNAQVALYQSGEVDFLVATDAIGMGLNMDVDHVAFSALSKFDGRRARRLRAHEIAQIAGRAGRHIRDGTFGTTGDAPPIPEEVAARIVAHEFDPVRTAHWRASDLRFSSVEALLASLSAPSPHPALWATRDACDEVALRALAEHADIAALARGRDAVTRLWAACQIPDFRKVTIDQHVRLIESFALHLLSDRGVLPPDWAGAAMDRLDNTAGDVDALSARLAHIRTWTYAANRGDWFDDAEHWRGVARGVEDRLSDALHERLTQRFVDKRTSALVRGLRADGRLEAHVTRTGDVMVEGHFVGRLEGLLFKPDSRDPHGDQKALESRALRHAALRALRPELDRRLGALARADDETLHLADDLTVRWNGAVVARLQAGPSELTPRVVVIGADEAAPPARTRAERRMEAWLQDVIGRDLAPLRSLAEAVETGAVTGLARGLAYQLLENLGWLDREDAADDLGALSSAERRALRALGARFGAHAVFFPALVRPKAARLLALLLAAGPRGDGTPFLPTPGRTSVPIARARPARIYAAAGYRPCGPLAVRHDALERLADAVREAHAAALAATDGAPRAANARVRRDTPFALTPAMTSLLGCTHADLAGVLKALGFRRVRPGAPPAETDGDGAARAPAPAPLWRLPARRRVRRTEVADTPAPTTPFAALASLKAEGEAASPTSPAPRRTRQRPRGRTKRARAKPTET